MATLEIEITHPDGSDDTVSGVANEDAEEFDHVHIASVFVDRDRLNEIILNEDRDEVAVYVDGETEASFRGVLRSVFRRGGIAELLVDSPERYAKDGERAVSDLVYEEVDDTEIIEDALDDVPEIDAGTIENIGSGVTFIFPTTSPAKRIRAVAEAVGAEVRYNADMTLDYVASLGEDRSETVSGTVLSPEEQNISGELTPERDAGDEHITHLTVLGTGEGPSQVSATLVPDADPHDYENDDRYENVHRYTAEEWEEGDRRAWDSRTNKDVSDADTLATHGQILIEEFNTEYLDIPVVVEDHEIALGDVWTVRHPEEQVDVDLRAVEVERIVDADGVRYDTVFSSRRLTRQPHHERVVRDTERYNMAFEGTNVTETAGPFEDAVDPGNGIDWVMDYYYPGEVIHEVRVKVHLRGRAYRSRSRGAAASGDDHTHSVSISDHDHDVEITVPNHIHTLSTSTVNTGSTDGHTHTYTLVGDSPPGSADLVTGGPSDQGTDTSTSEDGGGTVTTSGSASSDHVHDPEPGVIEFDRYPGECEVQIDGATVAENVGEATGEWTAQVDILGELSSGEMNEVRVIGSDIGEIIGQVDVDVYRQPLGRG